MVSQFRLPTTIQTLIGLELQPLVELSLSVEVDWLQFPVLLLAQVPSQQLRRPAPLMMLEQQALLQLNLF
jgi:hypothetical protein